VATSVNNFIPYKLAIHLPRQSMAWKVSWQQV